MTESPFEQSSPYHCFPKGNNEKPEEHDAAQNTWHKTFRAEKDLWRRIARNSASEIDATDLAIIPGFSQVQCP